MLGEALEAARAIGDERSRSAALAALAPHLTAPLLGEALEAARAIGDEWSRSAVLAALAPHLTAPLLGEARAIKHEWSAALAGLAPWSRSKVLAALAPWSRSAVLAALAPRLAPTERDQALREAVEAARAIEHEWSRSAALAALAPHLTAPLLRERGGGAGDRGRGVPVQGAGRAGPPPGTDRAEPSPARGAGGGAGDRVRGVPVRGAGRAGPPIGGTAPCHALSPLEQNDSSLGDSHTRGPSEGPVYPRSRPRRIGWDRGDGRDLPCDPGRRAVVAVTGDWWLEDCEKKAILDFHAEHPLEGYQRLAFMMLDADVVAVSPSNVYRVLSDIDMPRMDGIQLVAHIKQDPRLKAIPVVIVSYKDREEDRIAVWTPGPIAT